MAIRILLADDHKVVREGIRSLVEKEPSLEVVAEAGDGLEVIDLVREHLPNVVLMDINMPRLDGIEATQQIVKEYPTVKVLGLSTYSDKRFVLEMLKAGASGYLQKNCVFSRIVQAIHQIVKGDIFLNSEMIQFVLNDYMKSAVRTTLDKPSLTDREKELLKLLSEGKSTKEIAYSIGISVKTVETHRANIMKKLKLSSLADLVKYSIRQGITSLGN